MTVPNFWDHFLGGYQKAEDEYKQNKRRTEDASLGLMTELFKSGDVNAEDLNKELAARGITQINRATGQPTPVVQKSRAQRRREVLAVPGGVDQLSDPEREELGFKTTTQQKIEKGQAAEADVATRRADAIGRFMNGERINDQEREVLGVMSPEDRALQQMAKADPLLNELGERYVMGFVATNMGGAIKPGMAKEVAEGAYNKYIQERAQQFGTMTPEQTQAAKSYFERAVQNMLIAQKKLEIENYNSQTARMGATNAAARVGQNQQMQWFSRINSAVETLRRQQQDLLKSSPGLGTALGDEKLAQNPLVAGAVARFNALDQQINALKQAQGELANDGIPGNIQVVLGAADQVLSNQPEAGKTSPGAHQAPRGGAAQQGAPAPGVNIAGMAQALVQGQGTPAQLQELVRAGTITQAQYNQIIQQANNMKSRGR